MDVKEFILSQVREYYRNAEIAPTNSSKIARNFIKTLESGVDSLIALGIERRVAKNLYQKKALVEMGIKNGNWDMIYIKKKKEFWENILKKQVIKQSDIIDKNVTINTTHVIRLPNTIHGSTGLIAKKLSFSELEKFNLTTAQQLIS